MSTAMVVGGGGFQGLPVLRGLHAIGWRAIIADSVLESLNRFETDFFHHMPEATHYEAFRAEVVAVAKRHEVEAVFPTTMYDLPALARLRPELESLGIRVFASDPALIDILSDKVQAMSVASAAGLPVLPIMDPVRHDFSWPLIGKPKRGWGGLGIVRAHSASEWLQSVQTEGARAYLWQRELSGFTEWSVDFALTVDQQCSPRVCRRRLRASGGFAVVSDVVLAPKVESLASQTATWLAKMGGCGLFNVQFLEEADGSLWLSDVNPRPGTSSVCALAAGVNLVDFLVTHSPMSVFPRPGLVVRTLTERFLPRFVQKVNGVVFDLDETLICQKSWMEAKLDKVIARLHGAVEREKLARFRLEALRIIDEGPWPQLIDIALARSGLPASDAGMLIDLWRAAQPETIVIHQDAEAFIYALRARNIPIALLSDNPAASQLQKLAKLPESLKFNAIVLTDTLSAPKPDPKGFQAAAEGLSLPPENLLMVGDSPWRDAVGALAAGYAGALIIKREGSMSNPLRRIFEEEFPDAKGRIGWIGSLFGADRILEHAN